MSLVDDPEKMWSLFKPPPGERHNFTLAAVLDDEDHPAWSAAGNAREDAQLGWSVLWHGPEYEEDEPVRDPGSFDGGYGPGSYFEQAMGKDD